MMVSQRIAVWIVFPRAKTVEVLLAALALSICPPAIAKSDAESLDGLRAKLDQQRIAAGIVGMGVAALDRQGVVFAEGFGLADRERNVAYTLDTVQPIASVSKVVLAVALMRAKDLGILSLDDPAEDYLPFALKHPRHPDTPITLRHLATHTSGVFDGDDYERSYVFESPLPPLHETLPMGIRRIVVRRTIERYNENVDMPMVDFLKNLYHPGGTWFRKESFGRGQPGKEYDYSNCGSALIALAIESASGIDYREFVEEQVFRPLGMTRSTWSWDNVPENVQSAAYMEGNRIPRYKLITYPDGGLLTSVSDFAILIHAMMQARTGEPSILSEESLKELFRHQLDPQFKTGILWEIQPKSIGHAGYDPGTATFAYFNHESTRGFLVFLNTTDFSGSTKSLLDLFGILRSHSFEKPDGE